MADPRPPMSFPDWSGFGPKMLALRLPARKFVWAYHMNALTGEENGAQACRDAGYSDRSDACKVRAHELLHREDVLEALQEVATRQLRGMIIPATVAATKILQNPKHPDHRKMIEMVWNRTGLNERTQVDVQVSGQVEHVNHTDAAIEALEYLQGLNVPRETLIDKFGFSGLSRYERMLAEKRGKALPAPGHRNGGPVVIDGQCEVIESHTSDQYSEVT